MFMVVYECFNMSVCTFICIFAPPCVHVKISVYLCVSMYICVNIHLYNRISVCVYVFDRIYMMCVREDTFSCMYNAVTIQRICVLYV